MSSKNVWVPVGAVCGLYRYPVKGLPGEPVDTVRIGWHGLAHDRRLALHRSNDLSGLPWVSAREFPQILRLSTRTLSDGRVEIGFDAHDTLVIDVRNAASRIAVENRISEMLGEPIGLFLLWAGAYDAMPISLISTDSISALSTSAGLAEVDERRFRANLVLETATGTSGSEQRWIGRELRIGEGADSVVMRIDRSTTRCPVIDLDPATGRRDLDLFDTARSDFKNRVGVYATSVHPGIASVNAPVYIR